MASTAANPQWSEARCMHPARTSVSALIGMRVLDADGATLGTVRDCAVAPVIDAARVEGLVLRPASSLLHSADAEAHGLHPGDREMPTGRLLAHTFKLDHESGTIRLRRGATLEPMPQGDSFLLLERDVLDQQIIDVHGHKVVRVNDVDLVWESGSEGLHLRIAEVEVGLRGALRRLLKGLPQAQIERMACRLRPSVIPWEFVDLIDRDPARRVRLRIEQDRLSRMHPSDIAEILEDLAPAERQALFTSLDDEVKAEALEEVEPRTQKHLIESLNSEEVAGILEEMDPGAAADLLSELSDERSDAILEEMGEKERSDIEELLEYSADSAAGLMTTDYIAVPQEASTADAIRSLTEFEGDIETVTEIFLIDAEGHLAGQVPISRLMVGAAHGSVPLKDLNVEHVVSSDAEANGRKVAELFDKYNLRSLPVINEEGCLAGVIRAEHVIGWLRTRA